MSGASSIPIRKPESARDVALALAHDPACSPRTSPTVLAGSFPTHDPRMQYCRTSQRLRRRHLRCSVSLQRPWPSGPGRSGPAMPCRGRGRHSLHSTGSGVRGATTRRNARPRRSLRRVTERCGRRCRGRCGGLSARRAKRDRQCAGGGSGVPTDHGAARGPRAATRWIGRGDTGVHLLGTGQRGLPRRCGRGADHRADMRDPHRPGFDRVRTVEPPRRASTAARWTGPGRPRPASLATVTPSAQRVTRRRP